MGRKKKQRNTHEIISIDGRDCVVFTTGGKKAHKVIVDVRTWEEYLQEDHWTGDGEDNNITIKRNNDGVSEPIWMVIAKREWPKWRYFGRSIDHINRDRRDNRLENLRPATARQNAQNTTSKKNLIHRNGNGYKVDTNLDGKKVYRQFETYEEAEHFADTEIPRMKEEANRRLEKETRDLEFERGLREKHRNNELDEILSLLRELHVI